MQALEIFAVELERLQGQPDQVVIIHRTAVGERALVVGVDGEAQVEQGPGTRDQGSGVRGQGIHFRAKPRQAVDAFPQQRRGELQVLGQADEVAAQGGDQLGPMVAAHPVAFALVQVGVQPLIGGVRVRGDPGLGGFLQDPRGVALVHDAEIVRQPHQIGPLPHDVVGQPVQRAHPVADVRQQAALLHELIHAAREVVHRRVDQGDDQHLLVVGEVAIGDEPGGQRGQRLRLAAAGHGRHAHLAAGVGEDFGLFGTWV